MVSVVSRTMENAINFFLQGLGGGMDVKCPNTVNSSNRHLVKADTSKTDTWSNGPCHTLVIYFISLQDGRLSKADSQSWSRACPP